VSPRIRHRHRQRGVTLIEVLVVIAIVAVSAAGVMLGLGTLTSAKLRESATRIAGAIRVSYNHANAKSRTTRMVLYFGSSEPGSKDPPRITVEDSPGRMLLQSGDRTGGAAAATEAEAAAVEEASGILDGPRKARPMFRPITDLLGFVHDQESGLPPATKALSPGIYFRQVQVEHEEEPVFEDRAYVYFFPGGQAETAYIQVQKGSSEADENDVLTVTVAPLTGKVRILAGPADMPRPLTDEEASEREDTGF
jgi:general secretion pathway protein H